MEWREIRNAPREMQPDILVALANLDLQKALEIARGSLPNPSDFSWDYVDRHWIAAILAAEEVEERRKLAEQADAYVKRHHRYGFVRLSKNEKGVEFGTMAMPEEEDDRKKSA